MIPCVVGDVEIIAQASVRLSEVERSDPQRANGTTKQLGHGPLLSEKCQKVAGNVVDHPIIKQTKRFYGYVQNY